MGYQRGDNRYGGSRSGERWRDQDRGYWDREQSRQQGYERSGRDDDRGFFERAGDEVRSWFRDEDEDYRDREGSGRNDPDNRHGYRSEQNRGYGGDYDRNRRYDRFESGRPRVQGASPAGGAYASSYGARSTGYDGSDPSAAYSGVRGGDLHDPHYSEWRNRQIESLDRDYEEYRREHQSKFEQEFGTWRERRQRQRQAIGSVTEHMEVVGSDGAHIGKVDKVRGDRIILTKSDAESGSHHHSIPCGWIDQVDDKVTINKTAEAAKRAWQDEETSRALFEREDRGSDGPHALNRAFSGTY